MAENYWSREDDNEELDPIGPSYLTGPIPKTRRRNLGAKFFKADQDADRKRLLASWRSGQ